MNYSIFAFRQHHFPHTSINQSQSHLKQNSIFCMRHQQERVPFIHSILAFFVNWVFWTIHHFFCLELKDDIWTTILLLKSSFSSYIFPVNHLATVSSDFIAASASCQVAEASLEDANQFRPGCEYSGEDHAFRIY